MNAPTPAPDPKERELFIQALEQPTEQERAAFLAGECGNNLALRRRVESLLARSKGLGEFLENPVVSASTAGTSDTGGTGDQLACTEKAGDSIGRYKLLEKIGEGGMGVVYMAQQEEPVRRRVALKIIKLGMDTKQVVARFEAERQTLALMDHPNIAKVFDGGATDTGRPYFVMELVPGVPITEFCDKNQLLVEERIKLFIPVCQAIQSAHQKGIIHRDLKPTNILVTLNGGVPMPMVIDFGVAKATQQKLTEKTLFTQYAAMIGTPAYMSPEQAEMSRLDVDTRSDIYGLGVLLYELLTGTTPFPEKRLRSASYHEMQRIILEEEPERPSTRLRRTSLAASQSQLATRHSPLVTDLDWIVMKCLEKDRNRRYETANGLAADLKRHLNNEPVVARPPSTTYRLQKAWRRNKPAFTAAVVIAAALVVGIAVSSWQAVEASRARNAEKEQRLAAQTERDKAVAAQKEAEQARSRADHLLYFANMNLAQQTWQQNNIGQLRKVLEDTRDYLDLGFEWYYWQRQTHLALKTLRGHLASVNSVSFSPDGHQIVTGSWDGTAKMWDAASAAQVGTLEGHKGGITSVAFSPDGQRIVTGSADNTAIVWEAASRRPLFTIRWHTGMIDSVAFSPDGRRIVTGSWDKTAAVWDAASGDQVIPLKGHTNEVCAVAFSPDGQRIVTGSYDHTARVWEAATGHEQLILRGHTDCVRSVAFSPDGQRIATGSYDHTAVVWQTVNGQPLFTLKGHTDHILSVAYSPDGRSIATGSFDNTAKVWEASTGREVLTLRGHSSPIDSVAFSPNGQQIVTGSLDGTARVWEATAGREPLTLEGHTIEVGAVAFAPDGQRIVTGGSDGTAKLWDATTGRELLTVHVHSARIWSLAFSSDGQRIASGSSDGTVKVWKADSGHVLLTLQGDSGQFQSLAFSPDGQRIVTGGWNGFIRVLEAATLHELRKIKGHLLGYGVGAVAFSPDGRWIVSGSEDQTAKVWEAATGHYVRTLAGHSGPIDSVAFSPDGQRIVTGSLDNTVKVWEAASTNELVTLKGHSGGVYSVAFSPDGRRIVSGSYDHTAKVWEAASGGELLTLKGHTGRIVSVAFSPDGRRIVTGSRDGTAKVWEAARADQVIGWREEERAAVQYLTALRTEREAEEERQTLAGTHKSIKQWLILAPIALATGQSGAEGLDIEQIEGESRLTPKSGEAISVGGAELKWQALALEEGVIDFNVILGRVVEHSVAYAVCYLRSDAERHGLQMVVGSDDEAKVYLNAKQVDRSAVERHWHTDQDTVSDITLNAGLNVLVFKVVNETRAWQGSIRFADAQGNPVEGITVTLDPEGKDLR